MTRVVHIAGQPVKVGDHLVQRCSYCGALLLEERGVPDSIDGRPRVPTWGEGTLVSVAEDGPSFSVAFETGGRLPREFCGIPPKVTDDLH